MLGPNPEIEPTFAPPPIEGGDRELGLLGGTAESVLPWTSTPVGESGKHAFGHVLKDQVWGAATDFPETPSLLVGLRKAGASRGRIVALTLVAVMQQRKSAAGTTSAAKRASGLVRFFPRMPFR